MKRLKFLVLAVGLFVQGCGSQIPLFKDHEDIKEDEAVIVFNMYTTDYMAPERYYGGLYLNTKFNGRSLQSFSQKNHLSVNDVKQKYIVAKIPAGQYYFMKFDIVYWYGDIIYDYTVKLDSPEYSYSLTPLVFSVEAGAVKYLGDIEMQKSTNYGESFQPIFIISNRFTDAKKF